MAFEIDTAFQPTDDDFFELDELHERPLKPGVFRCRVVIVNLKGFQTIRFADFKAPPWRKGYVISFEGTKWAKAGFEGIYKVVDFSMGGYDTNYRDLGQETCRYELRMFMGIPGAGLPQNVPTPIGNLAFRWFMVLLFIYLVVSNWPE